MNDLHDSKFYMYGLVLKHQAIRPKLSSANKITHLDNLHLRVSATFSLI